ncbi:MAG: hypothetical protein R2932_21990 [Caldilineaceae bacterium]
MSLVPEQKDYILLIEIYLAGAIDFGAQVDHILDGFVIDTGNLSTPAYSSAGGTGGDGESIFDLVDVSGLTYDVLVNQPALTAIIPTRLGGYQQ